MTDFNLKDRIVTREEAEFKANGDLMRNRRTMAYWCLYTTMILGVLILLALVIHPSLLDNYSKVEGTIGTLVLGWFSIIGLYFGASTLAEVFGNKIK